MCAALWTQKLHDGLPSGRATEAPPQARQSAADGAGRHVAPAIRPAVARGRQAVAYASCESPFGTVHLAASAAGIRAVSLYETEASFRARLAPPSWDLPAAATVLAQAMAELAEYFAGTRRAFDVPLDLAGGTPFDRRVWDAIAAIPYGETRTYGERARALAVPGAARAVGHGCGRNPVPLLIPCHRVLRADGGLGGYGAGGPAVKTRLLALERGANPRSGGSA